jgi:hypothetical protein
MTQKLRPEYSRVFKESKSSIEHCVGLLDESPDIDRVIVPEANQAPAKK